MTAFSIGFDESDEHNELPFAEMVAKHRDCQWISRMVRGGDSGGDAGSDFLSDLDETAARVARALRPGGAFVVQDYNHEGISVFPRSTGFAAAIRATRAFYAGAGGAAWVVGQLPGALRRAGLVVDDLRPVVRCGGPGSDAFRWADACFPRFVDTYLDRGLMTAAERRAFDADWSAMRENPDALFFSPIVVEVIARKPD